ncbi:MAG TPA: organomercurial lyase [Actinomycetota bacterium]|jgi:hypothetical protein
MFRDVDSGDPSTANDVRVRIYESFVQRARPPMPEEIAFDLGLEPSDVHGALVLAAQNVIVLVPGTHFVWLAHPFSGLAAPFQVLSDDKTWDAICIWDALGILALTGRDGRVTTLCPDCGENLTLDVGGGDLRPNAHLVHFGVPAARWYEDVAYT